MAERGKIDLRVEIAQGAREWGLAAAPMIRATLETLAPVVAAMGHTAREAAGSVAAFMRAATSRPPAKKPCAWCPERQKSPATHVTKWRKRVTWEDDLATGPAVTWEPGRRLSMCGFHAQVAERYDGVSTYRFRSLS